MCAIEAGQARPPGCRARTRRPAGQENSDLRRRTLQLHQPSLPARELSFVESALCQVGPGPLHAADFIALVEKHGIPYHEKTLGQLFCDRSARDILGMLEAECHDAGVSIFLNTKIHEVERTKEFVVRATNAEFRAARWWLPPEVFRFRRSAQHRFGYDLARQFGLAIHEPWPGLVPLLLNAEDSFALL